MVGNWVRVRRVAVTALALIVAAQLAWPSVSVAARPGHHAHHAHHAHRGPGGSVGRPVHSGHGSRSHAVHPNHGHRAGHADHSHPKTPAGHVGQVNVRPSRNFTRHSKGNALGLGRLHVHAGVARGHVHVGGSVSGVHAGVRINASPGHQRHSGAKPSTHGSGSGKNNPSTTTHGSRTPRPALSAKRGHQPAAGSFATVPTSRTPQHANPDKSQRTVTHRSHRIPVRHQHAQPQPRHQKPLSTQFFEQVTRPGSPAMILSLIVLMCLLGTAFVVLMGRRRKPRQSG